MVNMWKSIMRIGMVNMSKSITRIGMVNTLKRQQPHPDKNVSPRPPFGLQWMMEKNPHTTGQTVAGPKKSLYTGGVKELPQCTQVTQTLFKGENKTWHTEARNLWVSTG